MYISRLLLRGVALGVAVVLLPLLMRPILNPERTITGDKDFSLMPSAVVFLISVTLGVLALGQLQHAYYLYQLYRLLQLVAAGRLEFPLKIDRNTAASITFVGGCYRLEVLDKVSLDFTIYLVTRYKIEARKLNSALTVVMANEANDFHQVTFDEESFTPDYRKEMRRLVWALRPYMPIKGSFTP